MATTDPLIQHTFPTQAAWRDVKLLIGDANGKWGSFRQLEPIDFFPTYYPALLPPTEPVAPSSGPAANPCGTLTPDEQAGMISAAATAGAPTAQATAATLSNTASWALKPH